MRIIAALIALLFLAACSQQPPPPSAEEIRQLQQGAQKSAQDMEKLTHGMGNTWMNEAPGTSRTTPTQQPNKPQQ